MLKRVKDAVYLVVNENGFTYSNCLFIDDDVRLLIDSGAGKALAEIKADTVDVLLNSHHHIDHMRSNNLFSHSKVLTHPLEMEAMNSIIELTATRCWTDLMEEPLPFDPDTVSRHAGLPHRLDGPITDGQVLDCGKTQVVVIHTPGHTQGHCSFFIPETDLAFLSDICLTRVGPWYGGPDADIDSFISSINRILELRPARLATGHLANIVDEDPGRVLTEYRDRIYRREKRILEHLAKSASSIEELAKEHFIYQHHPNILVVFWEKFMLKKHIDRLIRMDAVYETDPGRYKARVRSL